jgi:hypothetical protein
MSLSNHRKIKMNYLAALRRGIPARLAEAPAKRAGEFFRQMCPRLLLWRGRGIYVPK